MKSRSWAIALSAALWLGGCVTGSPPVAHEAGVGDSEATLILVSLDGFRWDYVDWPEAATIGDLAARGVRAEGLIPVFPSKTFPCHYALATGLYPGHNGIVSNNMFDVAIGGEFHLGDRAAVEDTRWWGGEPIWVTAEKQGVRSAAMFWPGTEAEIAGHRPSYWHRYDKGFAFEDRVEQVLAWLDLPKAERPRVITLYFEHPNDVSHEYGPEAAQTRSAIAGVDAQVTALVAGIESRGLADRIDLILTSDHGMADVGPGNVIVLDELADFEDGEIFEQGAFVQIFPNEGRLELLHERLRGAHPELSVYLREESPERYHLRDSPRVAPLIGVPSVGWEALTAARLARSGGRLIAGDHGQDPADSRMHGVFVAYGPSFREGRVIERFESVEIYNLMAAVLGLEPAANDGDPQWPLQVLKSDDARPGAASGR